MNLNSKRLSVFIYLLSYFSQNLIYSEILAQQSYVTLISTTSSVSSTVGPHRSMSNNQCSLLQPCQNNGTCTNTSIDLSGYTCSCPEGYNGTRCQFDHRLCRENICWNNGKHFFQNKDQVFLFLQGTCNRLSNTTYNCSCLFGWVGIHCESKPNYCQDITCFNNGICRSLLLNYTCKCLGEGYSGRHCEIVNAKRVIYQTVSKSLAYIAIIAMTTVILFVIIMDILKYGFGIDPVKSVRDELKQTSRTRGPIDPVRHVVIRFTYVNAPTAETSNTD